MSDFFGKDRPRGPSGRGAGGPRISNGGGMPVTTPSTPRLSGTVAQARNSSLEAVNGTQLTSGGRKRVAPQLVHSLSGRASMTSTPTPSLRNHDENQATAAVEKRRMLGGRSAASTSAASAAARSPSMSASASQYAPSRAESNPVPRSVMPAARAESNPAPRSVNSAREESIHPPQSVRSAPRSTASAMLDIAARMNWENAPAESSRAAAVEASRAAVAEASRAAAAPRPARAATTPAAPRGGGARGGKYLPGRGKGARGLAAIRHRKILRDNIMAITRPDIRRLARRGGVKRISGGIYQAVRMVLHARLKLLISDCVMYVEHSRRKTVTTQDVVYALNRAGTPIYGFDTTPNTASAAAKRNRPLRMHK
ncbi:hypothetical protein ABW21_db0200717 [Orbilia brochopaga]|nr:hypothetical protein ABW21_db0200717 [Drechslerella brochopaga]